MKSFKQYIKEEPMGMKGLFETPTGNVLIAEELQTKEIDPKEFPKSMNSRLAAIYARKR